MGSSTGTWEDCSGPSRFKEEAAQHALVKGIHELTDKPHRWCWTFHEPRCHGENNSLLTLWTSLDVHVHLSQTLSYQKN